MDFVELALTEFRFLSRWGLAVARRRSTFVRFESSTVFVNVYHGRASYQVGLELGRRDRDEVYSLHEVLRAMAPDELALAQCQTSDPDVLKSCLARIANTVEHRFTSLLAGDSTAFETLRSSVSLHRHVATVEAQFGATIERADRAWENKEWDVALNLYQQAATALNPTRLRRLEYLQSRRSRPK